MNKLKAFEERHYKWFRFIAVLIFMLGLGLRCYQYLMGRSLWEDEAGFALNFLNRGFLDLLKPLDNVQAAPPLFLLSIKCFTTLFGNGTFALRAVPFLASVITFPLFYFILKELLKSRIAALAGFFTFAVNLAVIYYSSELKTYGIDLAACILIIYLLVTSHQIIAQRRNVWLAVAGSLCLLYSNTIFIILFCCAIILMLDWIKQKKIYKRDVAVLLTWFIVFSINYFLFIFHNPYTSLFKEGYAFAFPPKPLFSNAFNEFMIQRGDEIFFSLLLYISKSFYFGYALAGLILLSLGYALWKQQYRFLIISCLPIIIHFALSYFNIYPFWYRFLLYLMPGLMLLIAHGLFIVVSFLADKMHLFIGLILVPICCYFFTASSFQQYPLWFREIKPALNFINKNADKPLYITTPYTLYEYYFHTGYAKNKTYNKLTWNINPESYYAQVDEVHSNYLLLHAVDSSVDGYGSVMSDLKKRHLIVREFSYKTYTVSEVMPLHPQNEGEILLNYANLPDNKMFDLDGKKVIPLWDNAPVSIKTSLPKGKYLISFMAKGTPLDKIFPHIKTSVDEIFLGDFSIGQEYASYDFHYNQQTNNPITIQMQMDNDESDTLKHEDRNAFIKYIRISKE